MIVILLLYNSRFKTLANKQLTQLESSPTQYYVSTYKLVESKSKPALSAHLGVLDVSEELGRHGLLVLGDGGGELALLAGVNI